MTNFFVAQIFVKTNYIVLFVAQSCHVHVNTYIRIYRETQKI